MRVLGVLGGMGPRATVDFLEKVIASTPAGRDEHHIPVVTWSHPQIPSRVDAILRDGPSPLPALLDGVRLLERAGADVIAMPCNTAHHWFDELQASTSVPMVNVVDAVVGVLRRDHPGVSAVGVLATDATMRADVYARRLSAAGIRTVSPNAREQRTIMEVVRKVKEGSFGTLDHVLDGVVASLVRRGAMSCVLACTELPLIRFSAVDVPLIDATFCLAAACVSLCVPVCTDKDLISIGASESQPPAILPSRMAAMAGR